MLGLPRGAPRALVWTVVVTSLAFFTIQLDGAVLNVAIVDIGRSLAAPLSGLQWVINAYTLVYAALLLSAGSLSDRIGSRPALVWGYAIFAGTSFVCAASPAASVLVAARALQGMGAALLMPSSLALINSACAHDPPMRSRAVGTWAAAGGLAIALGPALGGAFVTYLGWRWIFLINVPIGLAAIFITLGAIDRASPVQPPRGFDWGGQISAAVALVMLIGAIIEAGPHGWHAPLVQIGFVIAVGATALFVWIESRTAEPMLPLSLFRPGTGASTLVIGFVISFCMYGLVFALALYFQNVLAYSAGETGLAFVPFALTIVVANLVSGRAAELVGSRWILLIGLAIGACGCLALSRIDADTTYLTMLPEQIALRLGIGLTVPAMTTVLLAAFPRERSGTASGALSMMRQTGAAVGVAWFGAIMSKDMVGGLQLSLVTCGILLAACAALIAGEMRRSR
jgi:DHA2 family methylenomycin A resistance protein-like MFS transporter